jgi:hypothetical protein
MLVWSWADLLMLNQYTVKIVFPTIIEVIAQDLDCQFYQFHYFVILYGQVITIIRLGPA